MSNVKNRLSKKPIWVQKFGGSTLRKISDFQAIVPYVQFRLNQGYHVIVVISAVYQRTNELEGDIYVVCPNKERSSSEMDWSAEYGSILSTGEQHSAGLLALALQNNYIKSRSFLARHIPFFVTADSLYCNAKGDYIDTTAIQNFLNDNEFCVPVVAGFQGVHPHDGRVATLEREGSDCSAMTISIAFNAVACEFFKDVEGIYDKNPKNNHDAQLLHNISYSEALSIIEKTGSVLHQDAVKFGEKSGIPIYVRKFCTNNTKDDNITDGTWIRNKKANIDTIVDKKNWFDVWQQNFKTPLQEFEHIFIFSDQLPTNHLLHHRAQFSSGPCVKPYQWRGDFVAKKQGRSCLSVDNQNRAQGILKTLREILNIPQTHEIFFIPGSATGAIEAMLWNVVCKNTFIDTLESDVFSRRWAHEVQFTLEGSNNTYKIEDYVSENVDHVVDTWLLDHPSHDKLFTWCGTSMGFCFQDSHNDFVKKLVSVQKNGGRIWCDATSAVGATPLPWEYLDGAAFSLQKHFAGEGGLGILVVSRNALENVFYKNQRAVPSIYRITEKRSKQLWGSTPSLLTLQDCENMLTFFKAQNCVDGACQVNKVHRDIVNQWIAHQKNNPTQGEKLYWSYAWGEEFTLYRTDFITTLTLKSNDPVVDEKLSFVENQWKICKKVAEQLSLYNIAHDICGHPDEIPCLRIFHSLYTREPDLMMILDCLSFYIFYEENEFISSLSN